MNQENQPESMGIPGGGGVTTIGGNTRCSRGKNAEKGISKSGVGAERADREKGVKIAKNGREKRVSKSL